MGLGKPHLSANVKVAIFSRCKNIKGELENFTGAPLAHGHAHCFCWSDLMMALSEPKLRTTFEVTSFRRFKILKKKIHNFWELD